MISQAKQRPASRYRNPADRSPSSRGRMRPVPLILALSSAILWASAGSAQQPEPQYIRDYKEKGLPAVGKHIEFEDHGAFPPRPKDMRLSVGAKAEVKAGPEVPIERLISQSRELALRDTRVRSALGSRFAVVGGGPVEPGKGRPLSAESAQTKLNFYSYSRNRAVSVLLDDKKVVAVTVRPQGFQPAETREEVAAAAEIVTKDPRFAKTVKGLIVRGIEASESTGNRLLYLLFYRQEGSPAVFTATVDMVRARVLSAKRVSR